MWHNVAMSALQSAAITTGKPEFDDLIKARVPRELRVKFARLAHRRMKTESELAREVLLEYIERRESEVVA